METATANRNSETAMVWWKMGVTCSNFTKVARVLSHHIFILFFYESIVTDNIVIKLIGSW